MLTTFAMSGATVAACLVTLSRVIGWYRILRYATVIDVAFTAGLLVLFAGTLGGALIAVLGGLFMAVVLTVAKRLAAFPDRLTARPMDRSSVPAGAAADEYNESGWVYNQAPYI